MSSSFVRNCVTSILRSAMPMRSAATVAYKHINPPLIDYFQNLGLSDREIKSLNQISYGLKKIPQKNVEEVLKLLAEHKVNPYIAVTQCPRILSRKPSSMRVYAKILEECGFVRVNPRYLLSFCTLKKMNVRYFKRASIIPEKLNVHNHLCQSFKAWSPADYVVSHEENGDYESLTELRMKVLQKYLKWRFDMSEEEFNEITETHNSIRHNSLRDIEESINIAENELKMTKENIASHPCIILADPVNTMKIINEIKHLHGVDAREALEHSPHLIKEDYRHIKEVNRILLDFNLSVFGNKRVLTLYAYKPDELIKRLKELRDMDAFNVFSTNKRIPLMVERKNQIAPRVNTLKEKNFKYHSLNTLVTSDKCFKLKLQNYGDKNFINDIAQLIHGNLKTNLDIDAVLDQLSRHSYAKNVPLKRIVDNIKVLSTQFSHEDILKNCNILLYSIESINYYLPHLVKLRNEHQNQEQESEKSDDEDWKPTKKRMQKKAAAAGRGEEYIDEYEYDETEYEYDMLDSFDDSDADPEDELSFLADIENIDFAKLDDDRLLNLVLFMIEKKFNFSHEGIWEHESPEN